MCGITGFLSTNKIIFEAAEEILHEMTGAIIHRGPDDNGLWVDEYMGIAIGHRRLSILDLSSSGHQPMLSQGGRYRIVFNGEIYNHQELRKQLACEWKGSSDTETLLAAFEAWGISETLKKCIGMFAFAVWDSRLKCLTLGRDRLGEKPLYYGWSNHHNSQTFFFASDLRSLRYHPLFNSEIDRGSLCLFLRYGYIPAPHSIYRGIKKLEPGTLITVSNATTIEHLERYWRLDSFTDGSNNNFFRGSPIEAIDKLDSLINSAISHQAIADVPLGIFLSGGIDSSLITAIFQKQSSSPVRTFTIGFEEIGFNEASYASDIARYLGTRHEEFYVTSKQALDLVPSLPSVYSEPFSDSSQIPTFLLARLARDNVTVVLTGDGGDELFCGYNRYLVVDRFWKVLNLFPIESRRVIANALLSIKPEYWSVVLTGLRSVLPNFLRSASKGDFFHKGLNVLGSRSVSHLHLQLLSRWNNPESVVIDGIEPTLKLFDDDLLCSVGDLTSMMIRDIKSYLPDDVLVKVDRATMAVSLEGRSPYLDHNIVEFALSLPLSFKLQNGKGKWILREVLYRYLPKTLIDRPKMGFGVPIAEWLRGPLKEWAAELLDESRLRREGYFHPDLITEKWLEHLSGRRNWQDCLWSVLMFQAWLDEN